MNSQIIGLRTASAVFGVLGMVQLMRLAARSEVTVGGYLVPLWVSVLAFLILATLSAWLFRLSIVHFTSTPQSGSVGG